MCPRVRVSGYCRGILDWACGPQQNLYFLCSFFIKPILGAQIHALPWPTRQSLVWFEILTQRHREKISPEFMISAKILQNS